MHDRGLISGGEGNVSARLSPGRLLVTPSGANKGFIKPGDLVVVDLDGRPAKGRARPSSEIRVHLAAYRARPSIGAVVHAHPPTAIAFTIAGLPLAQCLVPESIVALGDVPTAAYATPSTDDLAAGVERLLVDHDVVMMDRHGSVTVGRDVFEAYDRLESLEHTARITHLARALGPVRPLPPAEVARLRAMAEAMGLSRKWSSCEGCTACGAPRGAAEEAQIAEIVERVIARMG
jgi:L-fuculose-phosphate aldolase